MCYMYERWVCLLIVCTTVCCACRGGYFDCVHSGPLMRCDRGLFWRRLSPSQVLTLVALRSDYPLRPRGRKKAALALIHMYFSLPVSTPLSVLIVFLGSHTRNVAFISSSMPASPPSVLTHRNVLFFSCCLFQGIIKLHFWQMRVSHPHGQNVFIWF